MDKPASAAVWSAALAFNACGTRHGLLTTVTRQELRFIDSHTKTFVARK
jgi:hypothetical protein